MVRWYGSFEIHYFSDELCHRPSSVTKFGKYVAEKFIVNNIILLKIGTGRGGSWRQGPEIGKFKSTQSKVDQIHPINIWNVESDRKEGAEATKNAQFDTNQVQFVHKFSNSNFSRWVFDKTSPPPYVGAFKTIVESCSSEGRVCCTIQYKWSTIYSFCLNAKVSSGGTNVPIYEPNSSSQVFMTSAIIITPRHWFSECCGIHSSLL